MASATGTPMISAMAEVMIVPRIRAQAPNVQPALEAVAHTPPWFSCDTSQLLRTKKLKNPIWPNAVEDSPMSRMKK